MQTLSDWLKLALDIAGIVALVLVGFLAGLNILDKNRRVRQTDADNTDNRLISGLKGELELQQTQINRMDQTLTELRDINLKLTSENKTLREILQGRDDVTLKYQAEGRVAMSQVRSIYETQDKTASTVERLAQAIEKFVVKETEVETHTTITTHPKTT